MALFILSQALVMLLIDTFIGNESIGTLMVLTEMAYSLVMNKPLFIANTNMIPYLFGIMLRKQL